MSPGRLQKWPYQIHAHSLKGDADNGERDEGHGQWSSAHSPLALRALLTESLDISVHTGPRELVPQISESRRAVTGMPFTFTAMVGASGSDATWRALPAGQGLVTHRGESGSSSVGMGSSLGVP